MGLAGMYSFYGFAVVLESAPDSLELMKGLELISAPKPEVVISTVPFILNPLNPSF
jgi:hypothetical protein